MSIDGKGTKWHRNITENFNRLSRAHERYGQTDGFTMTYRWIMKSLLNFRSHPDQDSRFGLESPKVAEVCALGVLSF